MPATQTVYFANVAFYIPVKGRIVNRVLFDADYEKLVNGIMDSIFRFTGEKHFQHFTAKAALTTSKKTTLTVTHTSWQKPYKATVEAGVTGIQSLFDQCLHNTVYDGETMHEYLVREDYIGQDAGFLVHEGKVELPADMPFNFISMAFHNEDDTVGIFLDADANYVKLMQRWMNHWGSLGNTTFTITNSVTRPLTTYPFFKGDFEYALTVESPSWDEPKTVSTLTGNGHYGKRNALTDLCMETVVKTDESGHACTIEDLLEVEHAVVQDRIDFIEGTYPYTKMFKQSKRK